MWIDLLTISAVCIIFIERVAKRHARVGGYPDLANLSWIESPPSCDTEDPKTTLCRVAYSTLAMGGPQRNGVFGDKTLSDGSLGTEFSGYVADSTRRVMGLCSAGSLATTLSVQNSYLWDVPGEWSTVDAATVPAAYAAAYFALIVRGNLQPGESILIHPGTDDVGVAAINIALNIKCQVCNTIISFG